LACFDLSPVFKCKFGPMKVKKLILSICSFAIISVFLIAGSGFMTVSHYCKMCDVKTVDVYSAFNPEGATQACCSSESNKADSEEQNISSGCCELNSTEYSLPVNEITIFKVHFTSVEHNFLSHETTITPTKSHVNYAVSFFDKRGGRFIVNANRQLLT